MISRVAMAWLMGAVLAYTGGSAALAVAGAVAWPALEYSFHRWIFHGSGRPAGAHRRHHRLPGSRASVAVQGRYVLAGVAVLSLPGMAVGATWLSLVGSVLIGYGVYEYYHAALHLGAGTWWHKAHHSAHVVWYGVTPPARLIDRVLGTSTPPPSPTWDAGDIGPG